MWGFIMWVVLNITESFDCIKFLITHISHQVNLRKSFSLLLSKYVVQFKRMQSTLDQLSVDLLRDRNLHHLRSSPLDLNSVKCLLKMRRLQGSRLNVYNAVVTTLKEINQYNHSAIYPLSDLWSKNVNRKAD
ncbi:unnamed protein product [Lactuca virosa]|uniref:Factor of DNA methylation 1-5/IDN2 domain-containing protein n=1 Tax=Lactuca virosa TaxID=75947 RepID=A0AAU9M7X1_9ASTR|nr:unnamed protein product [Lactuca virosa]